MLSVFGAFLVAWYMTSPSTVFLHTCQRYDVDETVDEDDDDDEDDDQATSNRRAGVACGLRRRRLRDQASGLATGTHAEHQQTDPTGPSAESEGEGQCQSRRGPCHQIDDQRERSESESHQYRDQ